MKAFRSFIITAPALMIMAFGIVQPAVSLSAEQPAESAKPVYAALPFSSIGCSPTIGDAVGEMVLTRMYQVNGITVKTVTQVNSPPSGNDPAAVAQWGRRYSVDKVLTGTIQKFETHYIITVLIIDVDSAAIEYSDATRANVARDLIFTLDHLLTNVQRHVQDLDPVSGKTAIQLEGTLLRPWGSMGLDRGTGYLHGARISYIYRDERIRNFTVTPSIGVFRATITQEYITSCIAFHPELSFGRIFKMAGMLSMHPGTGFGLFITHTREDYDRVCVQGRYQHTTRTSIDPALSIRTDIIIHAGDRSAFFITPQAVYVRNNIRPSFLPGLSLGFRFTF
jgi:TolB-like protein